MWFHNDDVECHKYLTGCQVTTRAQSSSQSQESCFWSSLRNLWAHLLWSKFCKTFLIYFWILVLAMPMLQDNIQKSNFKTYKTIFDLSCNVVCCRPSPPPSPAWPQPPDGVAPPPPWSPHQWAPRPPLGLQQSLVTSSDTSEPAPKWILFLTREDPHHTPLIINPTEKLTMFSEILPELTLAKWTETEFCDSTLQLH